MKAVAGIAGALVGLLLVGLVAWFLYGRNGPNTANAGPPEQTPDDNGALSRRSGASDTNGDRATSSAPLQVPVTTDERYRTEYARKRAPFLRSLEADNPRLIDRASVPESLDTLDLIVRSADDTSLMYLLTSVITPSAGQYGFRHARFFVRNAPGSLDPVTLVAEATPDETGRWTLYRK